MYYEANTKHRRGSTATDVSDRIENLLKRENGYDKINQPVSKGTGLKLYFLFRQVSGITGTEAGILMKKEFTKRITMAGILSDLYCNDCNPFGVHPNRPYSCNHLAYSCYHRWYFWRILGRWFCRSCFGIMSFLQAPTDPTFSPIWASGGV